MKSTENYLDFSTNATITTSSITTGSVAPLTTSIYTSANNSLVSGNNQSSGDGNHALSSSFKLFGLGLFTGLRSALPKIKRKPRPVTSNVMERDEKSTFKSIHDHGVLMRKKSLKTYKKMDKAISHRVLDSEDDHDEPNESDHSRSCSHRLTTSESSGK